MLHLMWLSLGIPILIHLLFRRRSRRIPFSSLYFLRLVDQRIARRQRIKNWLLLATRLCILAAVLGALERPMLRTSRLGGKGVATTAVIVLDNSYSMQAVHADRSAFEQGRRAVLDILGTLGKGDAAALVLFNPEPGIRGGATTDLSTVRRAADGLECGWGGTDVAGALGRAVEALKGATTPRREVFVITDFQKRGWDGVPTAAGALPEGADVFLINVGGDIARNLALTDLRPGLRLPVKDVPTQLRVTLRNTGVETAETTVRMVAGERNVAERLVSLAPGGARTDTFAWSYDSAGFHGGYFQISPDGLSADNRRFYSLKVHEKIPVLVVNGDPSPIPFNDECFFLMAALRVSTHAGRSLSPIDPLMISAGDFAGQKLDPFRVVIMANVPQPDRAMADLLRRYVRRGGSLMIFLGPKTDLPTANMALWGEGGEDALLPARLDQVVNVAARDPKRPYETILTLESAHPALREIADELDVSTGRVKSYVRIDLGEKGASGVPMMRLSSGSPLLVEKKLGSGSVFLWTTSADLDWNNIALKPFFLPLIHQLIYYASRAGSEEESVPVGHIKRLVLPQMPEPARVRVERVLGPEGARDLAPLDIEPSSGRDGVTAEIGPALAPGLYSASWAVKEAKDSVLYAVNVDAQESDLERLAPDEAARQFGGRRVRVVARAEDVAGAIRVEREGLPLWDYLFAAAIALAVLESFIANRWMRG